LDKLSVNILEPSPDRVLDSFRDLLLDETSGERSERLVEQVVLRVANGELKRVDFDGDVLDVEDGGLVFAGGCEMDFDGETFAAEEDVCETRVLDLRDAGLLLEVEGNITHIGLDLAESEGEVVVVFIGDGRVRRDDDMVVRLDLDGVGEQVASLEGKVLDDQVELVVGILNAGDGDISDLVDELGQDDLADVIPQLGLEGERAVLVEEDILGEAGPVLAETLVEGIRGFLVFLVLFLF